LRQRASKTRANGAGPVMTTSYDRNLMLQFDLATGA
jgi:hypothetical protein